MKTAEEIYDKVSGYKKYLHMYGLLNKTASVQCMKEYAKEVVEEATKRVEDRVSDEMFEGHSDVYNQGAKDGAYVAIGVLTEFKNEL